MRHLYFFFRMIYVDKGGDVIERSKFQQFVLNLINLCALDPKFNCGF